MRWGLERVEFSHIEGWADDDHAAALSAFTRHMVDGKPLTYKTGRIGIPADTIAALIEKAAGYSGEARAFFEDNFVPVRLNGLDGQAGKVTGFYEPELDGSRVPTEKFSVPFLLRPDDLFDLKEQQHQGIPEGYRFGRQLADGSLVPYFDRAQIETGALDGKGLEFCFVANPVDAFFIHVQGAARINLPDGQAMRISYDGKSGHPFTGIGRLLIERGEIAAADISMQSIRAWLANHPADAAALMRENRSYIFFKETPIGDPALGPVAAARVQLTARRSLAVDRLLHTFSTPIFVAAEGVSRDPFRHLMIAQETGTAIVGASRGDIFFGTGDQAGEAAGAVNAPATFTLLVPNEIAQTLPSELDL